MARVLLPPALLALFPGAEPEPELSAGTVAGLLDALDARWPGMRDRLRDSTPAIRRHIRILVDGVPAELGTAVADGAEVVVLTAISGG